MTVRIVSISTGIMILSHQFCSDKRYTCIHQGCLPTPDSPPVYFSTWTSLQHHIRTAHPPTCVHPSCKGKTFSSQKGLRAHEKIHEQRDLEAEIEAVAVADLGSDADIGKTGKRRRGGEIGRDWKCDNEGCTKDFKSVWIF
jgi:general transcription factor IIIA